MECLIMNITYEKLWGWYCFGPIVSLIQKWMNNYLQIHVTSIPSRKEWVTISCILLLRLTGNRFVRCHIIMSESLVSEKKHGATSVGKWFAKICFQTRVKFPPRRVNEADVSSVSLSWERTYYSDFLMHLTTICGFSRWVLSTCFGQES